MMLLDSHVVLWFLDDSPKLGQETRARAASGRTLHVSAASVWELAVKSALGKLRVRQDLPDLLAAARLTPLPVTQEHAWAVREIELRERDPFDADAALLEAGPATGCQVHDARR